MTVTTKAATMADLVAACAAAVKRADRTGLPVVASCTYTGDTLDPLTLFTAGAKNASSFLWIKRAESMAIAGIGAAATCVGTSEDRFRQVGADLRSLLENAVATGEEPLRGGGLTMLGGFAFDVGPRKGGEWAQFPAGLLTLPALLATSHAGRTQLTVNHLCAPGSDAMLAAKHMHDALAVASRTPRSCDRQKRPAGRLTVQEADPDAWKQGVAAATRRIKEGAMEKVVLARAVRVVSPYPFVIETSLRYLANAYPNCYVFAIRRGPDCFLGATPEQLVSLHDNKVNAMCLAGSSPRASHSADDDALGKALLASAKDRREHEIVVRALTENLRKVCSDICAPDEPGLLRLANVQHLYTPVSARILPGLSILDVVEQLHPTPAVGGYPRAAALAEIAAREPADRGWYAGPVGWVDSRGCGEFAVALRSALVSGNSATLYAGCGIVADSQPDAEYEESCLKLRPMLAALEADMA